MRNSYRPVIGAESYTPALLRDFLIALENTDHSTEVWRLLLEIGTTVNLPMIDFICASSYANWKKTLFIRTSYDATWLNKANQDPEMQKWSYFRSHAMHYLTPIVVGADFVKEYWPIPNRRIKLIKDMASFGMRTGFSVPVRLTAPPQAAVITFAGDMSREEILEVISEHGWTLNTAAIMAHQRYMTHFVTEFSERNKVSEKQRALLELIGQGLLDKQIAETLGISISAVRQRMVYLMEKTGQSNRAELAALAMSMGIVPDPLNKPGSHEGEKLVMMDKSRKLNIPDAKKN